MIKYLVKELGSPQLNWPQQSMLCVKAQIKRKKEDPTLIHHLYTTRMSGLQAAQEVCTWSARPATYEAPGM